MPPVDSTTARSYEPRSRGITRRAPRLLFSLLRMLFSRLGKPYVCYTHVFSFNDPHGMCPNCNGLGRKLDVDLDKPRS